jgi:7-cyano-7-deazaguanine synthase in queuosine biosynthesis
MKHPPNIIKVFCGELCKSNNCDASTLNLLHKDVNDITANIMIGYRNFVNDPESISKRILDLLQIAAYVFCADRMAYRGKRDSLNNDGWARSFEFNIPVYDIEFWNNENTKKTLSDALQFMTGDRKYSFIFHTLSIDVVKTENKQLKFSIFNSEYETIEEAGATDIMLFSGGLDSLAGAVQHLNDSNRKLCFVSHQANNAVIHTQSKIVEYLKEKYKNRIRSYGFECRNHSLVSKEETQRTRMFLFSAIAFALCNCYEKHEFYIYENGITSINLAKQGDIMNARASRTTHPKTLGLLRIFYRLFDKSFNIITPYRNKTKAEVIEVFNKYNEKNIISSSVSCSATRNIKDKSDGATHCGCCSQCIDRRFSIFAASLQDYDAAYSENYIVETCNDETIQRLMYTMRLACMEGINKPNSFLSKYPEEISALVEYWPGELNPDDKFNEIYELIKAYGHSVLKAVNVIRIKYENLRIPVKEKSLLEIVNKRDYLNTPFIIKVSNIDTILRSAIPKMFQREKPKSENDFNDKLSALLNTEGEFAREYPALAFGITTYKPDHSQDTLLIESKYIRGKSMTPSKATEDISADAIKASNEYGLFFVVYDPERKIIDDNSYIKSLECKRNNCFVRIYR